ncbi:SMP-30/gluconolactonase/LRE family protein [Nocardia huaxiensis]|uniref:SMP-30/gluconolactonase/LRE family protein n=1 Tax=Nocardia huaxiensis TaxID=2755382 RepID=UPI001E551B89|nr:hypothetical protein [Nocardia huaxiensis]UFS93661.1 hypothetical protein LPY97_22925 [Nocardia huaxiensis]
MTITIAAMVSAAAPATAEPTASVFVPAQIPGLSWSENLAFDDSGALWVSKTGEERVVRYDASGRITGGFSIAAPAGLIRGQDGSMYVNAAWAPSGPASLGHVFRFDPHSEQLVPQFVADATWGANGLTVDNDGNLYATDAFGVGIVKIRPDGSRDEQWMTAVADLFSPNGITAVGDWLYVTVTLDMSSPIYRIRRDRPHVREVVARLETKPLPRLLDDLTVAPDGTIYVASTTSPLMGELLRVDPETGTVTTLFSGPNVTSPRLAPDGSLYASTGYGHLLHITL